MGCCGCCGIPCTYYLNKNLAVPDKGKEITINPQPYDEY